MTDIPSRAEIEAAARRIAPHAVRTPIMTSRTLWDGGAVEMKLEQLQTTGTFKFRGAVNSLLSADVPEAGIVAASGGNHGAAVAHAAMTLGIPAHIFVPDIAGPSKIAVIERTGARLTVVEGTYAEALAASQVYKAETGAMEVHAYDAFGTVAGQGTLAREWEEQGLEADTLLIAVGGGGLIGGTMAWLGDSRRIVAVEPERAPTLHTALREGPEAEVEVGGIAANALGARRIGRICHSLASRLGIPTVLVPDEAIASAQRHLWQTHRLLVEPAGATALAALMCGAYVPAPDEKVAILICGANPVPDPLP